MDLARVAELNIRFQHRDSGQVHDWRLLGARSPDEPSAPADGMGGEGRDAHRHDRPLGGRQRSHRGEELIGPSPVHDAQDGVSALGQAQCTLPPVLGLLVALDQRRRTRPSTSRLVADGERPIDSASSPTVSVLPSARTYSAASWVNPRRSSPSWTGKTDDQLAPERPAHRHALADLADVREPVAGGKHGRREVGLELAGDARVGAGRAACRVARTVFGHAAKRSLSHRNVCNHAW